MNNEIVYLNGEFIAADQAKISIFDRSVLMADAVYEVTAILNGQLIDNDGHLNRLVRSLKELNMQCPISLSEIKKIQLALMKKNNLTNGEIYIQISRGVGKRNFLIDTNLKPTIFMFPIHVDLLADQKKEPLKVITMPDIRWKRRDIKTTQLLAQSLAKTNAHHQGYDDVWFFDENGYITEGSANNAWIIKNNILYTRQVSADILNGITKQTFQSISQELKLTIREQAFTIEEAENADEAFVSSAGMWARPIKQINDSVILDEPIGPITRMLQTAYINLASK